MKGLQERSNELAQIMTNKFPNIKKLQAYQFIRKHLLMPGYEGGTTQIMEIINKNNKFEL